MLLLATGASAQNRIGTVKGIVVDTLGKKPLASATINILDGKDSSLVTFARTRENGSFEVLKLDAGSYLLLISYTGFSKLQKPFSITAANPEYDFGVLPMTSSNTLADVTITAAPVQIKGDTVEYNAGSFKTKPNAAVEDLLKKLPGVTVERDGTVKANGQEVKRVLVDGKQFFGNDPKLATKNLQAEMVNKVQVFEKKSDQSEFTGFDDGNTEPTINLTLKNDKRTGVFGRASAGAGTEERYAASANINKFKKGEQISFIGQANNINQQGFSLMDALSFSGGPTGAGRGGGAVGGLGGNSGVTIQGFGGSGQGITTTQAAGLNYNNFKNEKIDFNASYFFNGTQLDNNYVTSRETIVADSVQLYVEPGKTQRDNYNHRFNATFDWKIDSFNSLKITPSFSYQNTQSQTEKYYSTVGLKGGLLTQGSNTTANESYGYNFGTTALWRHRFAKKGRTFSFTATIGQNESNGKGSQYTVNNLYNNGGAYRNDTINQRNNTTNTAGNYNLSASYTEPMSKRSIMEFFGYYNHSQNTSDRRTYDYNKLTGAYDSVNKNLTNYFDNDYNYAGGGINYKANMNGWNYTVGATLQQAELSSILQGKTEPISQSFFNVLPNLQIQIGKNRYRTFRMFYNGTTRQPSVSQLQPVVDNSDPLNLKVGNPNLKQEFTNNVRINYNSFDPYTMKSLFIFVNARQSLNAIVSADSFGRNGGRITTYDNVDGVFSTNGNMAWGFPVKFGKTRAQLNLTTTASYSKTINILNGDENKINNYMVNQSVSISYFYKELLDFNLRGGINWNQRKASLQEQQNTEYIDYTASFEVNAFLPKGFTIGNDVDFTANTGRGAAFSPTYWLWNASIAKTFLKNKKGELKLTVFDLLKQNTGVTRTANANYIEDTRYSVLQQYFMLTFSYNLSKFGSMMQGGGQRMMMMGMPR
jgi:hypothetical protein